MISRYLMFQIFILCQMKYFLYNTCTRNVKGEKGNLGLHGFFSVQNCSKSFLRDATDGKTQFRQGMARKTEASTDFGPAARHAATIIHIDLEMVRRNFLVC